MPHLYILDTDYDRLIRDAVLDQILEDNRDLLRDQEQVALTEMASLLAIRYDVSQLFPAWQPWRATVEYKAGMYVRDEGRYYRALPQEVDADPNTGQKPSTSTTYWTANCFPNIDDWQASEDPVAVGEYRVRHAKIYRCAAAHTNQDPADEANAYDPDDASGYWVKEDPRDPKLVEIACELALYKVHCRISPDQIPELRVTHYELAMEWLKDVAAGKRDPGLPALPVAEGNQSNVRYGSISRRTWTH